MSEANLMRAIQLDTTPAGLRLYRNNVGVLKDSLGRHVRFGVGGVGGSDLIGWTPIVITPDMVGRTVAVFTAAEVKVPGGNPTIEQALFVKSVKDAGGIAGVVHSTEETLALAAGFKGK